ncbi:Protein CBG25518 [Caenorhabditis briggsae]|uniref:Protein CBG25518 n=1 Tax=Caenorhabditis briggsae TaxID=6238 RepID=B6IFP3_CAEBR|nr:Protein CBG25518 [Caenorhabditis briggsae]CAR98723.1 Protein CBG25518 [Caenorhabditis briggsae]
MTIYRRKKGVFSLVFSFLFIFNRFGDVENLRKREIKSINHEIQQNCFAKHEKVRIFSSHHFLAIFEFPEIVSLMVLNGSLCFINSSGIVFNLEKNEKILESSPLLHPILAGFQIENRIFLISQKFLASFGVDSPLDYETYETEKTISSGEARKFGENRLMIFDRKSQVCSIWEMNKPKILKFQISIAPAMFRVI